MFCVTQFEKPIERKEAIRVVIDYSQLLLICNVLMFNPTVEENCLFQIWMIE